MALTYSLYSYNIKTDVMSSKMKNRFLKINIANYIKRLKNIDFMQPLIESVINSLDAGATSVDIIFDKQKRFETTKDGKKEEDFIVGFTISDNGEGFTEKNIESFFDMFSSDQSRGKLGSGRFIWLKVFKNVDIESRLEANTVKIHFCDDYDKISIEEVSERNAVIKTTIKFSGLTEDYKDKAIKYDINNIRNFVENEIFAKLLLLKNERKKHFDITFDNAAFSINEKNIPDLKKEQFDIKTKNVKKTEKFYIFYDIKNDGKGQNEHYYAAHGRKVRNLLGDVNFKKLPNNASSRIIVTSKYFDENVNDDRNNFNFDLNNTTDCYPISFSMINDIIEEKVTSILKQELPGFDKYIKYNVDMLIEQHPYIAKQIYANIKFARDPNKLLKKSFSAYELMVKSTKDRFSKALKKKNLDDDTYKKLTNNFSYIEACELGRYICFRQQIIECLNKLHMNNEKYEDKLHDLFATKHELMDKYVDRNLWLLDDKFMNYLNSYSDDKISKIKKDIKNNNPDIYGDSKEPDIVAFYNKETGLRDVVVIEFKAIGANNDDKLYSYSEINRNNSYVARNLDDVNAIYSYVITSLNDKLISDFYTNPGVIKMQTEHSTPILYWYNEKTNNLHGESIPCHNFIIDTATIIRDSDIRNKMFLEFLRKT